RGIRRTDETIRGLRARRPPRPPPQGRGRRRRRAQCDGEDDLREDARGGGGADLRGGARQVAGVVQTPVPRGGLRRDRRGPASKRGRQEGGFGILRNGDPPAPEGQGHDGTRRVHPVRRGTATRGDRPLPRTRRGHLPARRTIGLLGLQPTDGSGADDPASHGTGSPHGAHRGSLRALVSFYGMLAHGFTRNTFVAGEGNSLSPVNDFGRQFYCPPNSAGNGHFLQMLRNLLVQDWDLDDDGKPETLR